MHKEQLIREALSQSSNVIDYYVSQILAEQFPDQAMIEGIDGLFDIEDFAQGGHCELEYKAIVHNQVITHWQEPDLDTVGNRNTFSYQYDLSTQFTDIEVIDRTKNAWMITQWQGHTFEIIVMRWTSGYNTVYHYWILAETKEIAKEFMTTVCRWNSETRGEVLVFDGGCWRKNARLFQAIKGVTFDNLILKGRLKQDIRQDLEQFFLAKTTYEEYGIPWKRGILFVGPPGNGKTHAVKAIINTLNQTCLYVKSFKSEHSTDEDNIRSVFERARKSAPCILVLEDLDSLLTSRNRSFFLNELDGFATNTGIVALATTNHPERLDPAILDRPSRFDRKYPFNLPELAERAAYISMWNASLKPELHLSDEGISQLAEQTEAYSFAYLKELFLSSLMRWINKEEDETMAGIMASQVSVLRDQMISAQQAASSAGKEAEQEEDTPTRWRNIFIQR